MVHTLAFAAAYGSNAVPAPADPAQTELEWEAWRRQAQTTLDRDLADAMEQAVTIPAARRWMDALFGNSPYLGGLALRDPGIAVSVLEHGPDATFAEVIAALNREDAAQPRAALMTALRRAKRHAALVVAMADIGGIWPLSEVTLALSTLAAATLSIVERYLITTAIANGQIEAIDPDSPERDSGLIVLGMGKLGARELNYSSDIDLIILFDADKIRYRGRDSVQGLMAQMARDLVRLMEERTADGYVFRTDLRLRPDPGSTPPAVSVAAAETYYNSVGQNWERAAMIKARPVAGDLAAGAAFLKTLVPYIWRKHLDFAAIRDINSIKRQIDVRQGGSPDSLLGHNVKLGHGGIREIEFFAQTQQLIWGGRMPALRQAGTVAALDALANTGRIDQAVARDLTQAYEFLRQVEHRLQMVGDQQTHSLPTDPAGLARFAIFMGYSGAEAFIARLRAELDTVRRHFIALFDEAPALSDEGNLVFTGNESDPETLATLTRLGFHQAEQVAETIRGWHHGRIRATRSAQARELLTELVPNLLRGLGRTIDPDTAFARFDEFLAHLPAGVQLFSLFQRHPELFDLVAEIMGEAPLMSSQLARRPILLDAVLSGDFFVPLDDDADAAGREIATDLAIVLTQARDYEDVLDLTRRWASDRRFQIGVQLIQNRIDGERAGRDFTLITEAVIAALLPTVEAEFARQHGGIPGGAFAVLGLGKLGSREMNILSDLDLIFVYRADPAAESTGTGRPLATGAYYARLGQRLINALAAPTGEGSLYEVDMRLRPSGNAGPIASSLDSFRRYHDEQAWTWERMALTRARVVAGDAALAGDIRQAIGEVLLKPRDPGTLLGDVASMRRRMADAHPKPRPWDCKHRRGALVDLEFIAQYLALRHAPDDPSVLSTSTAGIFEHLASARWLDRKTATSCLDALRFWHRVQQLLRISLGKVESEDVAPELLQRALTRATGLADPVAARLELDRTAATVFGIYNRLIERPAKAIRKTDPPSNQELPPS